MKKVKRVFAALLAAAMLLGMTACGGGTASTASTINTTQNGDAAQIIMQSSPESGEYDPAGAAAYVYFWFQTMCLKGLIDYDAEGDYVPAMAETWEVNDDATQYTFHIREDAKWSDGSQVTSADFKNTIVRALDPNKGSWYVDFLFVIKGAADAFNGDGSIDDVGVECPNDTTIIFTLEEPCSYFLDLCKLPTYMPSNVKYATNDNEEWDMNPETNLANGPYKMEERKAGEYIVFTKNEYYYDADSVKLQSLKEIFMDDDQAIASAYQTGEINVLLGAPSILAEAYDGKEDVGFNEVPQTNYIQFNQKVEPFDDIRVRQAFALAVNRTDIATVVGKSCSPSTTLVGKFYKSKVDGTAWGDLQGDLLEEDLDKAMILLEEAGYPNGEGLPEITYTYPAMSYEADVAQVLQAQWAALGVTVNLEAMEYEVYVSERQSGNLQLCRHQWYADYNDPTSWLVMYNSTNALNDNGWINSEYDDLLRQADAELDAAARQELLQEAEKILITEETIVCPLFTNNYTNLIDPSLTGYTFDVLAYPDFTKTTKAAN